ARIFNGATQECIAVLKHDDCVNSVAFSPDSKLLATGCDDKKARIFNGATQECIAVLKHDDCVNSVAFSPDNKLLATGCGDKKARIFNGATQECIAVLDHGRYVYSVAFSPDNKLLATGCSDKKARIFNGATQECIAVLNHDDCVNSVAFSPDNKLLATGCGDKKVRIFARYIAGSLEEVILLRMIGMRLQVAKLPKTITSPCFLLDNIATTFSSKEKDDALSDLTNTWSSLPGGMQNFIWDKCNYTIQAYRKIE
ncbi:MAG TPA: WD40 repeat domain-containing protein, partial [Candidatus Babeliales bacterium]|nr:WD40 repeat domain-containing protein [Candidatus Babeliales bacterium]